MFTWLRRIVVLLLLTGVAGGMVYLRSDGFAETCRTFVMDELEKRGIFVKLASIRVEILNGGLVAHGVEIFHEKERRTLLAAVNQLNVDLDVRELMHRRVKVDGVELHRTRLEVPVDIGDPQSDKIELSDLNARVIFDDDRIQIRHAESRLHGLLLSVTGTLLRPDPSKAVQDEKLAEKRNRERLAAIRARRDLIIDTAKLLKHFETARSPRLEIAVSGDLGRPEDLKATLHLTADGLRHGDYVCEEVDVQAVYAGKLAEITRMHVRDHLGTLDAGATYEIGGPQVDFHLRSGVDLPQLATAIFETEHLNEFSIYRGEQVEVTADGRVLLGDAVPQDAFVPVECTGQARVGQFVSRGEIFQGLSLGFGLAPEGCYFRDVMLRHRSGSIGLQAMWQKSEGFRYRALLRMDPNLLTRFADMPNTRRIIERFRFTEESDIFGEVEGQGPEPDINQCLNRGHLDLRKFKYRGVDFVHVDGDVEFEGRKHSYRNMRVERAEGAGSVKEVECDDKAETVKITGLVSDVDPVAVVSCFAQKTADVIAKYRFDKHPHVEVDGMLGDDTNTDVRVKFRAPASGTAHYDLWGDDYLITRPSGELHFKGPLLNYDVSGLLSGRDMNCKGGADLRPEANDYHIDFRAGGFPYQVFGKAMPFEKLTARVNCDKGIAGFDVKATLLDGEFVLRGKVDDRKQPQTYEGEMRINAMNFNKFGRIYSPDYDTEGDLTGHVEFTGKIGDWRALKGKGAVVILNGNLYSIPIIGPLTPLLAALLPRPVKGFNIAKEADATLTIGDGFVTTEDFVASTSVFNIKASGKVDILEDRIAFHAQVKFGKILGLVLFPVSKILEYAGEGTVEDPRWRARFFSSSSEKTPFREEGGMVREQPKSPTENKPQTQRKGETPKSPAPMKNGDAPKPATKPPGR